MKTIALIFTLNLIFPFLCAAAETNQVATVQTNAVITTNNIGPVLSRAIEGCLEKAQQPRTTGIVAVFNKWHLDLEDEIKDKTESGLSAVRTDRGVAEIFATTVFVVIDPANKIPLDDKERIDFEAGLCALALGNEGNVIILDMTNFTPEQKAKLRNIIISKLKERNSNAVDENGHKLDYDKLFSDYQVNEVGFVEEGGAKTADWKPHARQMMPYHSLDSHYDDKVVELMDKAQKTYLQWKGITVTNTVEKPVESPK